MSQVVATKIFNPCPLTSLRECHGEDVTTLDVGENRLLVEMNRKGFKRLVRGVIYGDGSTLTVLCLFKGDSLFLKVDVTPSKSEEFSSPHAGVEQNLNDWLKVNLPELR